MKIWKVKISKYILFGSFALVALFGFYGLSISYSYALTINYPDNGSHVYYGPTALPSTNIYFTCTTPLDYTSTYFQIEYRSSGGGWLGMVGGEAVSHVSGNVYYLAISYSTAYGMDLVTGSGNIDCGTSMTFSDSLIVEAPPNYIQIDFPTATSTTDFSYFKVSGSFGPYGPVNGAQYEIDWGASSTNLTNIDYQNELYSPSSTDFLNANVPKSKLLTTGTTYYAKAFLRLISSTGDIYPTVVASSSVISFSATSSFILNTLYNTDGNIPTNATTATSVPQFTITVPNWSCGFSILGITIDPCATAGYLILPSNDKLNHLLQYPSELQERVPLGYFFLAKHALDSLAITATTTYPSLSFQATLPGKATTTYQLLDFEHVHDMIGTSTWNTFQQIYVWLLWLEFISYLYFRIVHFEL